jgi:hypothetical protein
VDAHARVHSAEQEAPLEPVHGLHGRRGHLADDGNSAHSPQTTAARREPTPQQHGCQQTMTLSETRNDACVTRQRPALVRESTASVNC